MATAAASAVSTASGVRNSSTIVQSRTSCWNIGRSAAGMPSSSPITVTGNGKPNASTKSLSPSIRSRRSSVIAWTAGRSPCTRRAVNDPDTSRRSRVCDGGLIMSRLVYSRRSDGRSRQSGCPDATSTRSGVFTRPWCRSTAEQAR